MLKATVLLVLLTVRGDGPLGVNFVNFDSLPACQQRARQLQTILEKGGIKVVENRCLEGFQWFTKHRHRRSKGGEGRQRPRFLYLVVTSPGRAVVMPQKDMAACEKARAELLKSEYPRKAWCAWSEQRLLPAPPRKNAASDNGKDTARKPDRSAKD